MKLNASSKNQNSDPLYMQIKKAINVEKSLRFFFIDKELYGIDFIILEINYLSSFREVQTIVLSNIVTMSLQHKVKMSF